MTPKRLSYSQPGALLAGLAFFPYILGFLALRITMSLS